MCEDFFFASSTLFLPSLFLSLSFSPLVHFSLIYNLIFAKGHNPFAQFRTVNRLLFLKVFVHLISYYFKSGNNKISISARLQIFGLYFFPFELLGRAHLFCLIPCLTWQVTANTHYFLGVFHLFSLEL